HVADEHRGLHCPSRLAERGDSAKEELGPRWIWCWQLGVVHEERLIGVELAERWVAGLKDIWVVSEPLHAPVPYVAVNVGRKHRRQDEERNSPKGRERKAERQRRHAFTPDATQEQEDAEVRAAGEGRTSEKRPRSRSWVEKRDRDHRGREDAPPTEEPRRPDLAPRHRPPLALHSTS